MPSPSHGCVVGRRCGRRTVLRAPQTQASGGTDGDGAVRNDRYERLHTSVACAIVMPTKHSHAPLARSSIRDADRALAAPILRLALGARARTQSAGRHALKAFLAVHATPPTRARVIDASRGEADGMLKTSLNADFVTQNSMASGACICASRAFRTTPPAHPHVHSCRVARPDPSGREGEVRHIQEAHPPRGSPPADAEARLGRGRSDARCLDSLPHLEVGLTGCGLVLHFQTRKQREALESCRRQSEGRPGAKVCGNAQEKSSERYESDERVGRGCLRTWMWVRRCVPARGSRALGTHLYTAWIWRRSQSPWLMPGTGSRQKA